MCRTESDDIRTMSDKKLIEHVTGQETVTPLENELKHRLEHYVEVYGEPEPWE